MKKNKAQKLCEVVKGMSPPHRPRTFVAEMENEDGTVFSVEVESSNYGGAYEKLNDEYPESSIICVEVADLGSVCEDCGKGLTMVDFESYWDGDPEMRKQFAEPRCCERCAEEPG